MIDAKKYRGLTALKGLFIWIIVLHNCFLFDTLFEHIPGVAFINQFAGYMANRMFFMLSGFLMSVGYRERIRAGSISFETFLCKRLKKLYPMYALSNVAALAVHVWMYGISAINLKKVAFTFLLLQGGGLEGGNPYNSPTWFLSALFICYIFYYAGTKKAGSRTEYRVFLAAGIWLGYWFDANTFQIPLCRMENGNAYLNFFLGCAMAEVYPALEKYGRWLKPAAAATVVSSFYLMMRHGVVVISGDPDVAFSFMLGPMILYLAYAEGLCSRILRLRPMVYLGKISMGIFYWHLVLYLIMREALGGMTQARYGLYLLVLLFISGLSVWLMEKGKRVKAAK